MHTRLLARTVIAAASLLSVCCVSEPASTRDSDELERLADWMTGSFSSQEQAAVDSDFYDIRLEMARIWTDREDGPWLYVEQAAASALDRPYRQRVYHLVRIDDRTFRSDVYTFAEPLDHAGAWKEEQPLAALNPELLELREGCSITLRALGTDLFEGSTQGKGCESTLRGARYATSEVRITATELASWDRGFDATDTQVWGAEKGGYIFKKLP
jgi:hypothetical protein